MKRNNPVVVVSSVGSEVSFCQSKINNTVSPDCYLEKANQMEKLIANKMINTVLSRTVDYPNTVQIANELCLQEVKVEICNSPFHIRKADVPSISTTTKKLLSTAAEYLDEII